MTLVLKLQDLEFVTLWERLKDDSLPAPFVFTSRTREYHEFLREKREVAERLLSERNVERDVALEAIANPDLFIVVNGHDGRDPRRADARVRLLATRRGSRGFLVTQLAGETDMHSGGFTITECDPLRLSDMVVAALPPAEPGEQGQITLANTGSDKGAEYEYVRPLVRDARDDHLPLRTRKFLAVPATCKGTIDIVQGHSRFGPKGIATHTLEWRDLEDDGRYIIADSESQAIATAADPKRMISVINTRIAAVIRAIKDERA